MDLGKTSLLFHLCWKWKHDVEHCYSLPSTGHWSHFETALSNINQLVSMVLQTLCEINDCLCLEHVYPLVDHVYKFVQPFLISFSSMDELDVTYLDSIVELALQAKHDLCNVLLCCSHGHALLLSQFNKFSLKHFCVFYYKELNGGENRISHWRESH